ncbi:hypothetical protein [Bradyrhizobium sp. SZCCHNR3003]|uniref:hypothetical protein n=1 Tax=Bradyrhizobium sp. SZCCHNR3003 TaxID=3057387 RepID=UPI0029169D21|nr:hypothetical protein [Bradyrhizobium sp. SZCCHNR3003]
MSDAIESTPQGATRVLFGSLAFIFLLVGIEALAEKENARLGFGIVMTMLGVLCSYAAFSWLLVQKALSVEAQVAVGRIAQSRLTWSLIILILAQMIALSRFVEERRWPFSYPADPRVVAENSRLENALNKANSELQVEHSIADKWRFSALLRQRSRNECYFQLVYSPASARAEPFWLELLIAGGWRETDPPLPDGALPPNITLRIKGDRSECADAAQRTLGDVYPNPPSKVAVNQQTTYLVNCPANHECVQVELNY